MSYTYQVEVFCDTARDPRWVKLFEGGRQFLEGYVDAKSDYQPRLAHRIVRNDGKVVREVSGSKEVGIGQIAGWPTAEQYERAGAKALERAEYIREQNKRRLQ